MKKSIQLKRVEKEVLSPESYLKLNKQELINISNSEIIPPRLGKNDFGRILVHYKNPIYK